MTPPTGWSPPRWVAWLLVALAALVAAVLSFGITITALQISPIFLVPATGVVLLARFGRSAWPAFVAGDVLGQWIATSRSAPMIAALAILHAVIVLVGATWVADHDAWPGDLRTSVRYLLGAIVLSAVNGALYVAITYGMGASGGLHGLRDGTLWSGVGVLVGFLVGGTLLAAWLRPANGRVRPGRVVPAALGLVVITATGVVGLAGPIAFAVPVALLGTLLLTAREGRRWGSVAMVVLAACALVGAERGVAPMGGSTTTEAVADVMLTLALFGGLVLLLGGYRQTGAATVRPVATTAFLFAGMMVVAGIAGVGANAVVVADDSPLVVAGMFTAATAVGLGILRSTRPVEEPLRRRGLLFAVLAGCFYALNLGLFFAAMPLIGAGSTTALAMISPLPVVVLSIIFLRLRTSWAVAGAVSIIVAGAIIAALGSLSSPLGIVLATTSAVAFAGSVVCTRQALGGGGIIDVALASTAAAAVVALSAGAIASGPSSLLLSHEQMRMIALAAMGAQLIPILGRTWALQHMGADLVGAEGVLATATTALLSFWVLSPPDAPSQWIGLLVITAGAVLAALAGGRVAQRTPPR